MCSLEDREILLAIGYAEEMGAPLSLKELTLSLTCLKITGLGSETTIRRRLMRLISRGAVEKRIANHDGRVAHLVLSRKSQRMFRSYSKVMAGLCWSLTRGS